jgi:putative DNA primase/helicase
MGETNFSEMSKTSIIKKLTGQDLIGFEYKNKNPFEATNYAKILIATNNLPTTTDKTIGFYRRWLIIPFPNKFSEKKDILCEIPIEEYECLAVKCLIILKDLLDEREFYNEGTIEQRAKKFEDYSDPLEKFIKEFTTEEDVDGFIWKFEFEKRLDEWCKENRHRHLSEVAIGKKMKQKGFEQIKKYSDWLIDGQNKQLRAWSGIKWKENA